jgi:hypothetical protein
MRHLIAAGHELHVATAVPEFVLTAEVRSPRPQGPPRLRLRPGRPAHRRSPGHLREGHPRILVPLTPCVAGLRCSMHRLLTVWYSFDVGMNAVPRDCRGSPRVDPEGRGRVAEHHQGGPSGTL